VRSVAFKLLPFDFYATPLPRHLPFTPLTRGLFSFYLTQPRRMASWVGHVSWWVSDPWPDSFNI